MPLDSVIEFKREVYRLALEELARFTTLRGAPAAPNGSVRTADGCLPVRFPRGRPRHRPPERPPDGVLAGEEQAGTAE